MPQNTLKRVFYVVNTSVGQIPGLPDGNGRPRTQDEFPSGWNIEEVIKEARKNKLLKDNESASGFSVLWTGGSQEFAKRIILTQVRKPNPFLTWVAPPGDNDIDFTDPEHPGEVLPDDE